MVCRLFVEHDQSLGPSEGSKLSSHNAQTTLVLESRVAVLNTFGGGGGVGQVPGFGFAGFMVQGLL